MHRMAVVGCGYWGPNLVRNFRSLPGVKVEVICDKNQERLDHVAQLYPEVEKTTEFSQITSNRSLDMVAVATTVSTHHRSCACEPGIGQAYLRGKAACGLRD